MQKPKTPIQNFEEELSLLGLNFRVDYSPSTRTWKAIFFSKEGEHGNIVFSLTDKYPMPMDVVLEVWNNHRGTLMLSYPPQEGLVN